MFSSICPIVVNTIPQQQLSSNLEQMSTQGLCDWWMSRSRYRGSFIISGTILDLNLI